MAHLRVHAADKAAGRKWGQGETNADKASGWPLWAWPGVSSVGAAARTAMGDVAAAEPVCVGCVGAERAAADKVMLDYDAREKWGQGDFCFG